MNFPNSLMVEFIANQFIMKCGQQLIIISPSEQCIPQGYSKQLKTRTVDPVYSGHFGISLSRYPDFPGQFTCKWTITVSLFLRVLINRFHCLPQNQRNFQYGYCKLKLPYHQKYPTTALINMKSVRPVHKYKKKGSSFAYVQCAICITTNQQAVTSQQ